MIDIFLGFMVIGFYMDYLFWNIGERQIDRIKKKKQGKRKWSKRNVRRKKEGIKKEFS